MIFLLRSKDTSTSVERLRCHVFVSLAFYFSFGFRLILHIIDHALAVRYIHMLLIYLGDEASFHDLIGFGFPKIHMEMLHMQQFRMARDRSIMCDIVVDSKCVIEDLLLVKTLIIHRCLFLIDLVHLAAI